MLISNIKFNTIQPIKFGNQRVMTVTNPLTEDVFQRSSETKPLSLFEEFQSKTQEKYGDMRLNDICSEVTSNDENIIGEGGSKVVYAIPGVDDFVVAKLKNRPSSPESEITECNNFLSKYNFGQPIAENGSDIIIMKKVEGDSYSIPDFAVRYYDIVNGKSEISRDEALNFLSQINGIKDFPVSSFVDLAQQIDYLSQNGYKADNINPNNILVDKNKQKFNLIDLFPDKLQEIFRKNIKGKLNSVQDMINITTDAIMQPEYMKVLNNDEKDELMSATKEVIKKCKQAADYSGLNEEQDNATLKAYTVADDIEKNVRGNEKGLVERYCAYRKIYADVL